MTDGWPNIGGAGMPERPVPPTPRVPSEDGARLAVVLRKTQWLLDDVAHDLPAGRCTPDDLHRLATMVRKLGDHLDAVAGIVPGGIDTGVRSARSDLGRPTGGDALGD